MATKSIGLTGRDYSTLAGWASYVNALSLSAAEVGEVYNDSGAVADTTVVTVGGWSGGSGTNTVTLRAATGQGFKANASVRTNALRYNASNGAALTNSVNASTGVYVMSGSYLRVQGLQFKTTDGSSSTFSSASDGTLVMSDCILENISSGSNHVIKCQGAANSYENVLAVSTTAMSGHAFENTGSSTFTGCTAVALAGSSGNGFSRYPSGTPVAKNCASYGYAEDFKSYSGANAFGATSTNNATDRVSFSDTNPGSSGQTSLVGATEFENVSVGTHDLRVKSTSLKLKDNGATVGTGFDISGTARTGSYDIGAWEYTAGGGGATSDPPRRAFSRIRSILHH